MERRDGDGGLLPPGPGTGEGKKKLDGGAGEMGDIGMR